MTPTIETFTIEKTTLGEMMKTVNGLICNNHYAHKKWKLLGGTETDNTMTLQYEVK